MEAEAQDATRVGGDDLDPPARRMVEARALFRDLAGEDEGKPAQRFDIFLDFAEARIALTSQPCSARPAS